MLLKDIIRGLRAYWEAVLLLGKQGWWRFALVPGLISLAFGSVVLLLAWTLSDNIGRALMHLYPFEQGKNFAENVATFFGGAMILALSLVLFKNVVMLLVSPWMNQLSVKIERHLTGNDYVDNRSFVDAFKRTARVNLRILVRELFFILLLLLVAWIPIIDFIVPVGMVAIQAYYAGFGNLDYFMDRHYSVKESITFVKHNKGLALGNGLGFLLLLAIPIIGVFLAPTLGVAAATLSGIDAKDSNVQ
jgi:CysZ protein